MWSYLSSPFFLFELSHFFQLWTSRNHVPNIIVLIFIIMPVASTNVHHSSLFCHSQYMYTHSCLISYCELKELVPFLVGLWDSFLEMRIRLQKALLIANRLPQHDQHASLNFSGDKNLKETYKEGKQILFCSLVLSYSTCSTLLPCAVTAVSVG